MNYKPCITIAMLEAAKHCQILARGETVDAPEGLHMTGSGRTLKWVAVRGSLVDWAVYTRFADSDTYESVAACGYKVRDVENLRNILDVSDEILKMYRQ